MLEFISSITHSSIRKSSRESSSVNTCPVRSFMFIILSKNVAVPFRNNHRMLPKWNNDIFNITSPGQQTCFLKKSLFFISTLPLVLDTNSLFCKKHGKPTIFLTEKCFKSLKFFKLCFFNKKSANAISAWNLHEKH